MRLKILEGGPLAEQVAGAAKTPGRRYIGEGEEEETFEMEEPGIYLGKGWLKGEHGPPEVALAHEVYHIGKSPRRATSEEEMSLRGYIEDEVEAVLFASQSTGVPISREDIEGIKRLATGTGLSGSEWRDLVEACAVNVGYEKGLGGWF